MAKWFLSAKKADFFGIAEKYHIDPVIARVMRNRDIVSDEEIDMYLNGNVSMLHEPMLLKGMDEAVSILLGKIQEQKKIRIIGDYDVDGICATYILYQGIKSLGGVVDTVIPHRMKDGYGINEDLIKSAINDGVDTIVTCDNGIAAKEAFVFAKDAGLTCIVTDHHEVPFEDMGDGRKYILPLVDAIVDPKQEDCTYPFSEICGAYVAYQFIRGLVFSLDKANSADGKVLLEELLEIAGVATVCDIMPLKDENRIVVKETLKSLKNARNIGLRALMQVNGIESDKVSSYSIGFVIGPCMNATGRLDTADISLELLKATSYEDAIVLATQLKDLNTSRKEMTEAGVKKAMELLLSGEYDHQKILVLYLQDVHESLAGIIAGRVKEKTGKPTFVLTKCEEGVKGSARSIESYHLYEEMVKCRDLFTKFGGHKMAAGLSLLEENVDAFRREINDNCSLTEDDFEEKILIDVAMPMSYVTTNLIKQLEILEPFGNGNEKPNFAQKDLVVQNIIPMGKNGDMARVKVKDDGGNIFELVAFRNGAKLIDEKPDKIDVIYYPSINEFRGKESLQFIIQNAKWTK